MDRQKLFRNIEAISTITWMFMDYSWLSGYGWIAIAFGFVALILTVASVLLSCKDEDAMSGMLAFLWLLMNTCWVTGDIYAKPMLLSAAKFIFMLNLLLLFLFKIYGKQTNMRSLIKRIRI